MADRRESANDPGIALRAAMQGWQSTVWTAIVGFVTKFDPAKMTCEVQPTIQGQIRDEFGVTSWVTLPLLLDCPVVFPSGGGFTLTFPIKEGDECLVVFSSRCIDSWWQSGGVQVQAEMRMHDLSDGFVIVGPRSQTKLLPAISANDVQLRNEDGTSFVSITPSGEVKVTAPIITVTGEVTVNGNLTVTGTTTVEDLATTTIPSYLLHTHGKIRRDNVNQQTDPPTPGS